MKEELSTRVGGFPGSRKDRYTLYNDRQRKINEMRESEIAKVYVYPKYALPGNERSVSVTSVFELISEERFRSVPGTFSEAVFCSRWSVSATAPRPATIRAATLFHVGVRRSPRIVSVPVDLSSIELSCTIEIVRQPDITRHV